jgi:hypothetical protein
MSLLKRDGWKLLVFLVAFCMVSAVGRVFNPLNGNLVTFLGALLVGFLPYVAKQVKWKTNKQPFFVFVVAKIILDVLTGFLGNILLLYAALAVDGTILFLFVMSVFSKSSFSVRPLKAVDKWLVTVGLYMVTILFIYPFVFAAFRGTVFAFVPSLVTALLYIVIVYGLAVWTSRKAK